MPSEVLAEPGTAGAIKELLEVLGLPATLGTANDLFFIVEGVLLGRRVRILCDTRASISFVADHFVKRYDLEARSIPKEDEGLTVRLGNDSTSPIDRYLNLADFVIGGHQSKQDFYVLHLPKSFDIVLGMDFMVKYHVSLEAATKAIRIPNGDSFYTASGLSLGMRFSRLRRNDPRIRNRVQVVNTQYWV